MNPGSSRLLGRGSIRRLALVGALVALASSALASPAAAATPYGSNLVQNPGAQDSLNHWDTFADFKTVTYGPGGLGFPSTSASNAIHGGTKFFDAGLYDLGLGTCGDAQQQWKLKGIGSAIDTGHVKATLKGYAGTNGAADITAHLDLYFRNSENHSVASNGITKHATSTNEHYDLLQGSKVLPKHTRILRIHLWADGDSTVTSGDCQAFWDKLSVVLTHV